MRCERASSKNALRLRRRCRTASAAGRRASSARCCGSKPASTLRSASRLRSMTPAPISSTTDSATSQTISRRRVRTPTRAVAAAALLQRVVQIACGRRAAPAARRRGCRCRIDAPSDEQQHAPVDRDLVGARAPGRRAAPRPAARLARASSRPAAPPATREHQRFDQQLLEDAARVRRRAPRGSRSPCGGRARARTAGCRRSRRRSAARAPTAASSITSDVPDVADDQLLQRDDGRAPAGVRLRVLALEPLRDHVHLGLRLRERRRPASAARSTCALWLSRTARSASCSASGTQRSRPSTPHDATREPRRHHADDRVGLAVERAASGRRRPARRRDGVFQNPSLRIDDVRAPGRVFLRQEDAAQRRLRAHDLEEVRADRAGDDRLRRRRRRSA